MPLALCPAVGPSWYRGNIGQGRALDKTDLGSVPSSATFRSCDLGKVAADFSGFHPSEEWDMVTSGM